MLVDDQSLVFLITLWNNWSVCIDDLYSVMKVLVWRRCACAVFTRPDARGAGRRRRRGAGRARCAARARRHPAARRPRPASRRSLRPLARPRPRTTTPSRCCRTEIRRPPAPSLLLQSSSRTPLKYIKHFIHSILFCIYTWAASILLVPGYLTLW